MKKFILLGILSATSLNINEAPIGDWAAYQLKGKVKQVEIWMFDHLFETHEFDEYGYYLHDGEFTISNDVWAGGKTRIFYWEDSEITDILFYDSNGRIVKVMQENNEDCFNSYKYNSLGLIESHSFYNYDSIEDSTHYHYNLKGHILKMEKFSFITAEPSCIIQTYKDIQFDSQGNWIKRMVIEEDGYEYEETRIITYWK